VLELSETVLVLVLEEFNGSSTSTTMLMNGDYQDRHLFRIKSRKDAFRNVIPHEF
jgi:hypothetical protein